MFEDHATGTDGATGGVFDCLYDDAFTLISAEDSFYRYIGYTKEEFSIKFHNHLLEIIYEDEQEKVLQEIKEQLQHTHIFMYENRLVCNNGTKWIWISAQLMQDEQQQPFFHCLFHDITKEKEDQEALRISEQRFQIILSETQDIVYEMDVKNNSVYYSDNYEKKFGYCVPLENFPIAMFATDIIYEEDKEVVHHGFQSILQGAESMKCEYRLKYRNEGYRWVETRAKGIRDEAGNLLNIIGIIADIDTKKREIIQSKKEASLDPLTGLLNRRAFLERLDNLIQMEEHFALILVDIDDFKLINDQYGHLIGDQVLVGIAHLLTDLYPKELVGRYGGDEFIIAVHHITSIQKLFEKFEMFKQHMHLHCFSDSHIQLNCCMGASLFPHHGNTFYTLFNKADMAMYSAKMNGKNKYKIYSETQEMQSMPQRIMQKSFHDDVIEYAIDIFLNYPDNEEAIPALLTHAGMVFGSDRISIYQDQTRIYDWYRSNEYIIKEDHISFVERLFHQKEERMLYYNDVDEVADSSLQDWMRKRHTYAVALTCANVKGIGNLYVCLEDCHGKRENFGEESYTIYIISEIIAILLLREKNMKLMQQRKIERMHILMEYIPVGLMSGYYKPGYPYFFSNQKMLQLLGYENEAQLFEATQGLILNAIHPEDRESVEKNVIAQITKCKEYEIEYRMVKKDGSFIWMSDKGKLIQTEAQEDVIISICMDITQKKEYQNQLQIYHDNSNGGAYINRLDDAFTLLYANDLFYQIYEITDEEFAQMGNACISLVYQEDRAYVESLIHNAIQQQEKEVAIQFRTKTKQGKLKWISLQASFEYFEGALVMKGFILDITKEHNLIEEIEHKELIYRSALQRSNINVWEYDIKRNMLFLTESAMEKHALEKKVSHIPDALFEKGLIHPVSIATTRDLYMRLDEGIEDIEAEILTKNKEGNGYWWERIGYHMIYDEHGQPSIAVAIGEDISALRKMQYKTYHEQIDRIIQNKAFIVGFRCNLSKNQLLYMKHEASSIDHFYTYDELMEFQRNYVAGEEDYIRFQMMLNRDSLLDHFIKGKGMTYVPYRRKDASGNLYWVEAVGLVTMHENGHDISLTGVLRNIDELKKIETQVPRTIHIVEHSQIYRSTSFGDMVEVILQFIQEYQPCALLLFKLETKKKQKDKGEIENELVTYLKLCFANRAIIGKLEDELFAVFLYDVVDEAHLHEAITEVEILINVSVTLSSLQPVLHFGGVIDCAIASYEEIFVIAQEALMRNQTSPIMDYKESMVNYIKNEDHVFKVLDEWNFASFIRKVQSLPTPFSSIYLCLQEIRSYYSGDYAFLWDLENDPSVYEATTERYNRSDMMTALQKEKILALFDTQDEAVFIEDPSELEQYCHFDPTYKGTIYPYLFYAVKNQGKVIAVLGIYHPNRTGIKSEFLNTISTLLVSALVKLRLYQKLDEMRYVDSLTKLWNSERLRKYIDELQEQALISLGVISIDINGLKDINRLYGNHYGDVLLQDVATCLKDVYSNADIYRFAGDDFLVVLEDVSFDRFNEKLIELKSQMPDVVQLAIGTAWAEKQISLSNLIDNAEEQRSLDKQLYYLNDIKAGVHKFQGSLSMLLEAIQEGKLKMYLQKKVDSANGFVVGAEALVRYVDEEHGVVVPGKFIPFLESTGLIYYVDLYIYQEVNKLLASWREQGIPLIPISFNFSRITLLENHLIEKINEINQIYQVDRSLLEIEITENMGEIERKTIIKVCGQLQDAGYRIALDDFGSKYSNIAFLSNIHFNTLKFDKGLVDYLVGNESSHFILESIIGLCRKLDIYNVAEGVESKEQVDILAKLGCTYIQGYYYSKPVPYEVFDTSKNHRND